MDEVLDEEDRENDGEESDSEDDELEKEGSEAGWSSACLVHHGLVNVERLE